MVTYWAKESGVARQENSVEIFWDCLFSLRLPFLLLLFQQKSVIAALIDFPARK
jgi:hypothetical protein